VSAVAPVEGAFTNARLARAPEQPAVARVALVATRPTPSSAATAANAAAVRHRAPLAPVTAPIHIEVRVA
jgi:hypothetical protein